MPELALTRDAEPASTHRWYWIGSFIGAASLCIRLAWYPVVTSDYTYFVRVWFDTLASHAGFSAFASPFADYAPLYLYFIKILTFIPISSLYSIKTLSLGFDLMLALGVYLILKTRSAWSRRKDVLFIAAVVIFSLPTVMLNSSLWGQSDSLYAAGVVFSLLSVLINAPFMAALFFGLAISLKAQAVFFAPVLVGYLLSKKERWKYLLVPPATFLLSVLPAGALGGNLGYWLAIYTKQAGEYPYLSVSAQSIYAFVQPVSMSADLTSVLFWTGMVLAAGMSIGIVYTIIRRTPTTEFLIQVSLASVLLLPYFLPRMHERYFYVADIFATLYAFYAPRRALMAVFVVAASTLAYMPFLSSQIGFLSRFHIDLRIPALLLTIPIGILLFDLWKARKLAYVIQ